MANLDIVESDNIVSLKRLIDLWTSLVAQLVKNLPVCGGTKGLIPGMGRSPWRGDSYPLRYSGLVNSMDGIIHGVTNSRT